MRSSKPSGVKRKIQSNPDDFMEAYEVIRLMKISRATFYRLVNEGKIPGAIKLGDSWRIVTKRFWAEMEKRSA